MGSGESAYRLVTLGKPGPLAKGREAFEQGKEALHHAGNYLLRSDCTFAAIIAGSDILWSG
jgi:hypothetical protein